MNQYTHININTSQEVSPGQMSSAAMNGYKPTFRVLTQRDSREQPMKKNRSGKFEVRTTTTVTFYDRYTGMARVSCELTPSYKHRNATPGQLAGLAVWQMAWANHYKHSKRGGGPLPANQKFDLSMLDLRGVDFSTTTSDTIPNVNFCNSRFSEDMLLADTDDIIIFEYCDLSAVYTPASVKGRVWFTDDEQEVLKKRFMFPVTSV